MSITTTGLEADVNKDGIDLDWGFWDAQLDTITAIDSGEFDVVVYRGGYGSGKTVLGARQTIEKALATPDGHSLVLAQDFSKGGATTFSGFFEELPGENTVPNDGAGDPENSPLIAGYNRNEHRLTWINGHITRLGSADRWNRYAGAEFNWVWCDEVAHYETTDLYKLYEMLISRQRTKQGPNVTLWTSTGNGYNQFYDFVERQVDADGDPLAARIQNIVADSRNNPFLAEKEKLARQFEGTQREGEALRGGFAAAQGLVYDDFTRDHHVVDADDVHGRLEEGWRMYGYDAGWDDPRVLVEIGRTHAGQFVVLDVFYQSETQVEDAIQWADGKTKGIIYAEHEPAHLEKFKHAGWDATPAEKSLDEGIPAVRARLQSDTEDRPGLLVADADACDIVIQEFLSYQTEHVGKSGAQDHAMDAIRYAILTHEINGGPIATTTARLGDNDDDRGPSSGLPGLSR